MQLSSTCAQTEVAMELWFSSLRVISFEIGQRYRAFSAGLRIKRSPTVTDYTLAYIPGKRLADVELLFVTSAKTHSAAEALAFRLQQLKRAVVVGERTKGGANAGRFRIVNERFRVFVPVAHASSATGKSWDRVGIQPDIPSAEDDALRVAHAEALRRILRKGEN